MSLNLLPPPTPPPLQNKVRSIHLFSQRADFSLDDNPDDFLAGMKKKKKPAKKILVNAGDDGATAEDVPAEEEAEEEGEDLDFSSLKKKKKKRLIESQVTELEARLEEAGIVPDRTHVEGEDPFAKAEGAEAEAEPSGEQEEEAWLKSDRDYTYDEVPQQIFFLLMF